MKKPSRFVCPSNFAIYNEQEARCNSSLLADFERLLSSLNKIPSPQLRDVPSKPFEFLRQLINFLIVYET